MSKDHAELVVQRCRAWSASGSPENRALVRHALRSLVKRGHRGALAILGATARPRVAVRAARLSAKVIRLGRELRFSFKLQSTATRAQDLVVDYVAHLVKANGARRPKVFKLKRLRLEAMGSVAFEGVLSFLPMTTRKHYPGLHRLEALVNGESHPLGEFELATPERRVGLTLALGTLPVLVVGLAWFMAPSRTDWVGAVFWSKTVGCFLYGSAITAAFLGWLWLLDRNERVSVRWAVLAAASAGLVGNLGLHLHCASPDPFHMLLGHAGVLVVWTITCGWVVARRLRTSGSVLSR